MTAEPARRGEAAAEILSYHGRLQRAEAYAHVGRGGSNGLDNVGKAGLAGQIDPVGRDLNAGQHDLAVALGVDARGLRRGGVQRQAAQAASGVGDDAVGAEIDAAVLNLQHGASAPRDGSGGELLEHAALERLVDAGAVLARAERVLERGHHARMVVRAEYYIRAGFCDGVRVKLRIAAADSDDRAGVLVAQSADGLARFAPALGSDGAGVDDDGVGNLAGGGRLVAVL